MPSYLVEPSETVRDDLWTGEYQDGYLHILSCKPR
jgi:hypothetical protein